MNARRLLPGAHEIEVPEQVTACWNHLLETIAAGWNTRAGGPFVDILINACKGGPKAMSNFDYSGPMAETVLLGNVALRSGGAIEWDAKALKVKNVPEADRFVRKQYRAGWGLDVA